MRANLINANESSPPGATAGNDKPVPFFLHDTGMEILFFARKAEGTTK
jgi:hypothetical protein